MVILEKNNNIRSSSSLVFQSDDSHTFYKFSLISPTFISNSVDIIDLVKTSWSVFAVVDSTDCGRLRFPMYSIVRRLFESIVLTIIPLNAKWESNRTNLFLNAITSSLGKCVLRFSNIWRFSWYSILISLINVICRQIAKAFSSWCVIQFQLHCQRNYYYWLLMNLGFIFCSESFISNSWSEMFYMAFYETFLHTTF